MPSKVGKRHVLEKLPASISEWDKEIAAYNTWSQSRPSPTPPFTPIQTSTALADVPKPDLKPGSGIGPGQYLLLRVLVRDFVPRTRTKSSHETVKERLIGLGVVTPTAWEKAVLRLGQDKSHRDLSTAEETSNTIARENLETYHAGYARLCDMIEAAVGHMDTPDSDRNTREQKLILMGSFALVFQSLRELRQLRAMSQTLPSPLPKRQTRSMTQATRPRGVTARDLGRGNDNVEEDILGNKLTDELLSEVMDENHLDVPDVGAHDDEAILFLHSQSSSMKHPVFHASASPHEDSDSGISSYHPPEPSNSERKNGTESMAVAAIDKLVNALYQTPFGGELAFTAHQRTFKVMPPPGSTVSGDLYSAAVDGVIRWCAQPLADPPLALVECKRSSHEGNENIMQQAAEVVAAISEMTMHVRDLIPFSTKPDPGDYKNDPDSDSENQANRSSGASASSTSTHDWVDSSSSASDPGYTASSALNDSENGNSSFRIPKDNGSDKHGAAEDKDFDHHLVLIAQHFTKVRIRVAKYKSDYVRQCHGLEPQGHDENSFLTLHTFGPYEMTDPKQLKRLSTILLAFGYTQEELREGEIDSRQ